MVILHVKKGDKKNEFLFETLTSKTVSEVRKEITDVHNLRLKVLRLAMCLGELGKHGPIRPEETRGLSEDINFPLDVNAYGKPTCPDEYGYRTGCPPPGEVGQVLIRTAEESAASVSHTLVDKRKSITKEICEEAINNMRGAVMIAYPAFHKLPHYDPARMELEDKEELDGKSEYQDVLETKETSLWFAGKDITLEAKKPLCDYVGKNEKTKIVMKVQDKTCGAPAREARIDEDSHKAMLSYYYKKQEEQKRLQADEDDSYLDSQWADPKALKKSLVGGGRPIGFRGM